jgi:peptide/nickel transport system permease protein
LTKFIIRRLLGMIPILFIISVIVFTMAKLAPGDPFSGEPNPDVTRDMLERQRELWGLNDPIHEQYLTWLGKVLQGDFGVSINFQRPVTDIMGERMENTVLLGSLSLLITLIIAIPFGIISAKKPYSLIDYTGTTLSNAGLAVPSFYLGLLLIYTLAIKLEMFPSQGTVTSNADYTGFRLFLDKVHHLFLPALALGTASTAAYFRYMRSEMLEVMGKDYIRTARAKGLPNSTVLYKHTLRNALIPIITLLGFELANIFGGAIITEQVFSIPGLGSLFITGISNRDYPIIMAMTMLSAVLIVVGNLLADIFYSIVDPRIRLE